MKLNWNFLRGLGGAKQKPSVGGVWIFFGTAHIKFVLVYNFTNQFKFYFPIGKIMAINARQRKIKNELV